MKVSGLLSTYLYDHKSLDLPGIGRFHIDPSVTVPDPMDRSFSEFLSNIQFSQIPIHKPEPQLIEFIKQKTGKIAPLATSDLESFLDLGKELLNIGKPFHIEGIGSLQKNKDAHLEFTPADISPDQQHAGKKSEKQDTRHKEYDSEFARPQPIGNSGRNMMVLLGIIVGIAIIVGGGYMLYSRGSGGEDLAAGVSENTQQPTTKVDSSAFADSLKLIADSARTAAPEKPILAPDHFKFILETTHKARAIPRFAQVHDLNHNIQMETKDSTNFRIFVILPATAADSSWKKDSLKAWYWGTRPYKITIEREQGLP